MAGDTPRSWSPAPGSRVVARPSAAGKNLPRPFNNFHIAQIAGNLSRLAHSVRLKMSRLAIAFTLLVLCAAAPARAALLTPEDQQIYRAAFVLARANDWPAARQLAAR